MIYFSILLHVLRNVHFGKDTQLSILTALKCQQQEEEMSHTLASLFPITLCPAKAED
jgi:hypothetical protein